MRGSVRKFSRDVDKRGGRRAEAAVGPRSTCVRGVDAEAEAAVQGPEHPLRDGVSRKCACAFDPHVRILVRFAGADNNTHYYHISLLSLRQAARPNAARKHATLV